MRTVAGAAAGGVLGWVWGRTRADFQMWIPAVSALVCAAAAYYLGMTFDEGAEEKGRRGLADAYLRQLDKFRLGVESVLADA